MYYGREQVLFAVGVRGRGGAVAENEMERELSEMTGSLEQLGGLEEKEEKEDESQGLWFMVQRTVCASISR